MDYHDALLELMALGGIREPLNGHWQRAPRQESPPEKPTAERVKQRQAEQERRRREALAANIDMNMQSEIMADFEGSL